MKKRLYLDNCSFNRPYDDQSLLRNHLEAEAKTYIQKEILNGTFELAWSFMMDYEVSFNPFVERKNQISKWKDVASIDVDESERIVAKANAIVKLNVRSKDALHLACAIEAHSDYFITTDNRILNKSIDQIVVIDPINFLRAMEEWI
ncbi:MAG: PIN domain-containing protein [Kiritimatiellaeota bacterium]|nr:PIN domain-containing protein [Kiritimatiellota bacterium]